MSKSPAVRNFLDALLAVLAGNAIYFLLMPHLPAAIRQADRRAPGPDRPGPSPIACASPPLVQTKTAAPRTQPPVAESGWWYARFRVAWPENADPSWHLDLLIAHLIVQPSLERHRPEIHRIGPQPAEGAGAAGAGAPHAG